MLVTTGSSVFVSEIHKVTKLNLSKKNKKKIIFVEIERNEHFSWDDLLPDIDSCLQIYSSFLMVD